MPATDRFPHPELDDMPDDIRERIVAIRDQAGFIPNVLLALARRPAEFRAFLSYNDALMEKDGGLSKAEREMIVVAVSSVNKCSYCVTGHGAILRVLTKNPFISDQVASNYLKADITPRERAILDFAIKVTQEAHAVGDEDFETLRRHGLDDEDAWDITGIAGFFGLSNRLANVLNMRCNEEYYRIGRKLG